MNIAVLLAITFFCPTLFAFYALGFDAGREHQHQLHMKQLRDKIAPYAVGEYSDD